MSDTLEQERMQQRYIIDGVIRGFDTEKQNKITDFIEEFKTFSRNESLNRETIALLIFFYNKLRDKNENTLSE